jgi:hypothetical protein
MQWIGFDPLLTIFKAMSASGAVSVAVLQAAMASHVAKIAMRLQSAPQVRIVEPAESPMSASSSFDRGGHASH